jgi:hypothetical protein
VENREPGLKPHEVGRSVLPSRHEVAEASEQLAIMKQRQILGFGALILTLATIVTLAALRQAWVAGIVATGLPVIVAIFVTGQYRPAPAHIPQVAPHSPLGYLNKSCPAPHLPVSQLSSRGPDEPHSRSEVFVDGTEDLHH